MAMNTTAKTNWAPTITLLMPATELMPITLSTVTRPIAASTKTQAGTIGKSDVEEQADEQVVDHRQEQSEQQRPAGEGSRRRAELRLV